MVSHKSAPLHCQSFLSIYQQMKFAWVYPLNLKLATQYDPIFILNVSKVLQPPLLYAKPPFHLEQLLVMPFIFPQQFLRAWLSYHQLYKEGAKNEDLT